MSYQPVIIIGAARSGTKLVRDLIASHPQVEKIPFDINYVWRIGNEKLDHDEISQDLVTAEISKKIRRYFDSYHHGASCLAEKTVSNCLRIQAVNKVFPAARYIHLYRNGWDVIESSYRQWIAPPDWRYIIAKTRSYPLFQAFGYATNYAARLFRQVFRKNPASITPWGPCYEGIYEDIKSKTILEVCAIQWRHCVESSVRDLNNIPNHRVYHLAYEDFINDPQGKLVEIAHFLNLNSTTYLDGVVASVSIENIGKGLRSLSKDQKLLIEKNVIETSILLERHTREYSKVVN